jgi:hypothetical protein
MARGDVALRPVSLATSDTSVWCELNGLSLPRGRGPEAFGC